MADEIISILCGGPGLGFYNPGLIVSHQLRSKGYCTETAVFEEFIKPKNQQQVVQARREFHRNFKFALVGQKLTPDIRPSLDTQRLQDIYATWRKEQRKRFIVFSGFWVPIIEDYIQESGFSDIKADFCHVDAAMSASWGLYKGDNPSIQHVWFCNWDDNAVNFTLHVSPSELLPYELREDRYIIHGGGWGMGTYKKKIALFEQYGLKLDVVAYERQDLNDASDHNYYMMDPVWMTWDRNSNGEHRFPPFGKVEDDGTIDYRSNPCYPEVYDIIRRNKAIISKPGGATLIDSLSSATPIVLLEPFGDYEKKNGALWENLGFGISYQDWLKSGCSEEVIRRLHSNLIKARRTVPDYVESLHYAAQDSGNL